MVVAVGDHHPVGGADGDVVGVRQLAGGVALRAERAHERAVRLEHLPPTRVRAVTRGHMRSYEAT